MIRIAILCLALTVAWTNVARSGGVAVSDLPVVELADLVVAVLPPNGFDNLGWDYMVDDPMISWRTNGTEATQVATFRAGSSRVRVAGVSSKVLRRTWEELAWSVTLWTDGNPKFGPKWIEIKPGGDDPNSACFGANFRGCTFGAATALASSKLKSRLVCSHEQGSEVLRAYSVSAAGKKPSLVIYQVSGGSGGTSAWLDIRPLTDQSKVCKPLF